MGVQCAAISARPKKQQMSMNNMHPDSLRRFLLGSVLLLGMITVLASAQKHLQIAVEASTQHGIACYPTHAGSLVKEANKRCVDCAQCEGHFADCAKMRGTERRCTAQHKLAQHLACWQCSARCHPPATQAGFVLASRRAVQSLAPLHLSF